MAPETRDTQDVEEGQEIQAMKRCRRCDRPISHTRSICHGMGPTCWKLHLEELREAERQQELFTGYSWARWDGRYLVTNPEHECYCVTHEDDGTWTCTCVAYLRETIRHPEACCKHIRYIQRELLQEEAERILIEADKQRRREEREAKKEVTTERRRQKMSAEERAQTLYEIDHDFD